LVKQRWFKNYLLVLDRLSSKQMKFYD